MIIIVFLLFGLFQYGRAPIHYAAIGGDPNVTQCLLENGANLYLKDEVRKIGQTFCLDSNFFMMHTWTQTIHLMWHSVILKQEKMRTYDRYKMK